MFTFFFKKPNVASQCYLIFYHFNLCLLSIISWTKTFSKWRVSQNWNRFLDWTSVFSRQYGRGHKYCKHNVERTGHNWLIFPTAGTPEPLPRPLLCRSAHNSRAVGFWGHTDCPPPLSDWLFISFEAFSASDLANKVK